MAKIPERYTDATFEGLKPERKQALLEWIEQRKTGKESLMIYGKPGRGKTHALYSLLQKNPTIRHRFYNSADLIEEIKQSFRDNYARNPVEELRTYEGYVFIDDFGSERLTDFVQDQFYQIINSAYINKRSLIISTNFSLPEISDRLGERIASRLAEMCFIINFGGEDLRFKK